MFLGRRRSPAHSALEERRDEEHDPRGQGQCRQVEGGGSSFGIFYKKVVYYCKDLKG